MKDIVEKIAIPVKVVPRGLEGRGGSVILNSSVCSVSGAHCDPEPACIICIKGMRTVWFANAEYVPLKVLRKSTGGIGKTRYLPDSVDIALNQTDTKCEVKWSDPVYIHAGDAIFIPRGIYHSVLSSPNSIALVIEIGAATMKTVHPRVEKKFLNTSSTKTIERIIK